MNSFIKPFALCAFLVANVVQLVAQCPNPAITATTSRIIHPYSIYSPVLGWINPQARLPNGTVVTTAGTYNGISIKSIRYPLCDSIIYTVNVVNDYTCRVPDSIKLLTARQIALNKGLNPGWDLMTPFATWNGVVMNPVTNCVDTAKFFTNREICVERGGSYTAVLMNQTWMGGEYKWYRNNDLVAITTVPNITVSNIQPSDTGLYKVVWTAPSYPVGSMELIRVKFCCTPSTFTQSQTIRSGQSVLWGSIPRTTTGSYRDTLRGQNWRGCDSIRVLNLTVVPCNLQATLNTFGDRVNALVTSGVPSYQYRWSSGSTNSYDMWVRAGLYRVTITDAIGCEMVREINLGTPPTTPPCRLDNVSVPCNAALAWTSVILTRNVLNVNGYTFEVGFDPTKVTPVAAYHALGRTLVTQNATEPIVGTVVGNKFRVTVGFNAANYTGSVGDTLIRIAFAPSNTNTIPADPISVVTVKVSESVHPGLLNIYELISNSYNVGSNAVMAWVLYQGSSLMNISSSPIYNPTWIYTYQTRNNGPFIGSLSTTSGNGILPLGTGQETWVRFVRTSQVGNGSPTIGGFDAYLTARVVNRDTILPVMKLLAMDVDQNGFVDAADMTHILRRAVGYTGYTYGFPKQGNATNIHSWLFFPKEYLTSNATFVNATSNRVPAIDSIFKLNSVYRSRCDTGQADMVSILLGDVNGDYTIHGNPARLGKNPADGNATLGKQLGKLDSIVTFENCKAIYLGDLTWKIPVKANMMVSGLDLQLKNRNALLQILSVTRGTTSDISYNIDSVGNCFISAYATQGAGIQAETPICYVTVKGSVLTPTATQLGTIQAFINGLNAVSVLPCQSITNPVDPELPINPVQIFPNPTNSSITIQHADIAPKSIQVFNTLGRLMSEVEAGKGSTMVDLTDFAKGVYFIKVDNYTQRVVKQ
jgi:Secretion system C-terminal sorting domain